MHASRNAPTASLGNARLNLLLLGLACALWLAPGQGVARAMGHRPFAPTLSSEMADDACMRGEERLGESHRVSEWLVDDLADEARRHGVCIVLAGINQDAGTEAMETCTRARGLPAVDIAQLLKGRNRIRWDGHASGPANRLSAAQLAEHLLRL